MWYLSICWTENFSLTDVSEVNLLLFELSCFRNIVLSYFENAFSFPSEITLVFCSVQYKKNKKMERQSIVPSSSNQLLVAQSKQEFLVRSKFFRYMGGVEIVIMGCGQSKIFV